MAIFTAQLIVKLMQTTYTYTSKKRKIVLIVTTVYVSWELSFSLLLQSMQENVFGQAKTETPVFVWHTCDCFCHFSELIV